MINRFIHIVAFGCLGTTTEVWFTAVSNQIALVSAGESIDLSLVGHSYVWMFFIYALAALLFPLFFPSIARWHVVVRLLIYMLGIFAIEYLAGAILDLATGSCPWEYDSPWAVHGYIRLDYAPFWMAFGFIIEKVFTTLNSFVPVCKLD